MVRPETKARVLDIARRLNYRVDRNAAGLRTQQSRTLAVLLFADSTEDDSQINPFFLAMLGSIARAAAAEDYDVLLSFQQLSAHWHARYEISNRADGIILLGYGDYVTYGEKLQALAEAQSHFIIWGPIVADQPGHSLGCDNVAGAEAAVTHLLERGRDKIAFLGGASEHCPEFMQRYVGHAARLRAAGIDPDPRMQFDAENIESSGRDAARRLLASKQPFDAVFAASDLIAVGAVRALQSAGLRVPEDVAVVGFDDIPAASYLNPALTTIRQDTQLAGAKIVTNLIRLIEGAPVESSLVRPQLVVRESS